MLITDPNQPDNPIVFVNDAFSRLTGYARHEILGRNCRFLQGPETDRDEVARLREAISAKTPIELDLLNYKKDSATFWNRVLVSPVFDGDGTLSYFFASQFDVTLERERLVRLEQERFDLESEVARRDAELIASEQRLRFALKAGQMGSWSLDIQSQRMIASEGCKENFGRPISEPFSYEDLMAAVHPDDRTMRDEAVAAAIASGSLLDVEYRLLTPGGEERWVQVRGQANYRADGTPLAMIGVSQDITGRKRAEEHRALLAGELSHRVKNSLAMIQAVISQTLRRASSLEEAGETLQARVLAMAAANDILVQQSWKSASLRELLQRTLAPFGAKDGAQFHLAGPDVQIPPRIATSLALGMHEMATNASKYGALSVDSGEVRIVWEIDSSSGARRLLLRWSESGGPTVSAPDRTGFGTTLIERVLARDTGGAAKIDYAAEGVILAIEIPLFDDALEI
ncbi:PAS domain S-box-containing protein [Sphingobium sp. B2D3A]|nr:PAS domain S-box-containing protein [Sphingobium sp. B2D3A]MCW2386916.1 PAS domain S-box-containing protein [Sphingobium sp. B2D3D]